MSSSTAVSQTSGEARVLVLGGGLAGLKCVHDLVSKHGFRKDHVLLLEASSSIGGRIKTDTSFVDGFKVDLGAELIHGDATSLFRLAEEKGWEMEELISLAQGDGGPLQAESNDGFGLFYVGGEERMLGMDSKDPAFIHLNEYLGSLADLWPAMKLHKMKRERGGEKGSSPTSATHPSAPSSSSSSSSSSSTAASRTGQPLQEPQSLSLRDGLLGAGVGDTMMGIADAGYANTVGAALGDTSLMGTCFLEHEWDVDGDRTFVLKGSLGQVLDELSAGLESCIQTDWTVASVDYSTAGLVTVTCRDGRIERGTQVVSALPLSVLQDGDVEFVPPLPEAKLAAHDRMGLCSVVKVILKFDRPVLPPLLHGCICSESFIPEFWFRHMPDIPEGSYTMLAVGFTAGPPADAVSALKPEEALKNALDQLDDMFRGRKWLKGGGCTGKGDWEEAEVDVQPEGNDPNHSETEGIDPTNGQGDAEHDEDGLNLLHNRDIGNGQGGGDAVDQPRRAVGKKYPKNEKSKRGGEQQNEEQNEIDGEGGTQRRIPEGEGGTLPSTAYVGGLVHDWVKDEPFVRGGYSYPKLGFDENTHADAAASVNGSLFFAGEHTNTPTGMTVHAAIDSGERAAVEVLRASKEKKAWPSEAMSQASRA
ncbi:unnamed protein product [Pylaiella littoralis]